MSRVTINRVGIENFFTRNPLAGSGVLGLKNPNAEALARRMAQVARDNASGTVVRRRTGQLAASVEPIVRRSARTGAIEVGVGTTSEYGGYLEHGTSAHPIPKQLHFRARLMSAPGHPDPIVDASGRRIAVPSVNHPGFEPKLWLEKAVNSVIGRGI